MNDYTTYPALWAFLGGYFHQDCDLVYDTEDEAVEDYIRTHWRDDVEQAIEEIDRFLREHPTGLLAVFNAEFEPDIIISANDDEAQAWLIWVRDQLLSGLDNAPSRSS